MFCADSAQFGILSLYQEVISLLCDFALPDGDAAATAAATGFGLCLSGVAACGKDFGRGIAK
jgi:hypothetical protein